MEGVGYGLEREPLRAHQGQAGRARREPATSARSSTATRGRGARLPDVRAADGRVLPWAERAWSWARGRARCSSAARCSTSPRRPGVKVDKHSTGGVGDKVSLCARAAGRRVRSAGADDLRPRPGPHRRHAGQARVHPRLQGGPRRWPTTGGWCGTSGACLIGQTADARAGGQEALRAARRDGTVDCIPLIASLIMSKKLAEGIDALVLDVKVGSGAFMKTHGGRAHAGADDDRHRRGRWARR